MHSRWLRPAGVFHHSPSKTSEPGGCGVSREALPALVLCRVWILGCCFGLPPRSRKKTPPYGRVNKVRHKVLLSGEATSGSCPRVSWDDIQVENTSALRDGGGAVGSQPGCCADVLRSPLIRLLGNSEAAAFPSLLSGWLWMNRSSSPLALAIASSHGWLIAHSHLRLFLIFLPNFFFSWHFKNAIWWLKLRQTAAAVWWLGDSSSPSPEPSDTQRSKLAPRVKPTQSIKCNRWFWRWIDSTTSDPFEELFRMQVWDHGWATVSHGDGLTTPARWLMVLWPGVPSWASWAEFKTGFGSSSPPPPIFQIANMSNSNAISTITFWPWMFGLLETSDHLRWSPLQWTAAHSEAGLEATLPGDAAPRWSLASAASW